MDRSKQKKDLNTKLPQKEVIKGIHCNLEPVDWDLHTENLY